MSLSFLHSLVRAGGRLLPILLLASLVWPGQAAAHAAVVASDPAAGSSLAAPPRQVTVRFNIRIDHGRSRLVLVGPDAVQHALDPVPDGEPTVLTAPLGAGILVPGAWRLRWQVLAMDGHVTRGDIPFTLTVP
ncbi:copper resistance CopC family protein [Dankookia sp. GCM10030260]|uniref:copper resistance CopC family protein n=1 Tax=Dankookia sp. GCM10030260 TaxID=3273390 RepID=UPI0036166AF3